MSVILWKTGTPSLIPIPVIPLRNLPRLELLQADGTWSNLTPYIRSDTPIVCHYGIDGSEPTDRVASSGSLTWDMDNGARAGVPLGWTSVTSPSRMPGWRLNAEVRYSVGPLDGGPRTIKFQGAVASAQPSVDGKHGQRRTNCTALDWWDVAARLAFPDQNAAAGVTSGAAISSILNALPTQPTLRPPSVNAPQIDSGSETFAWVFDGGTGNGLTVRERINQICLSELGYAYLKGRGNGTQFVYEDRQHRQNLTPVFALDDDAITSLVMSSSRDDIYNHVRVIVHPIRVDAAPTTVLYSLASATALIPANGRLDSLTGPYRASSSASSSTSPDFTGDLIGATGQIQPQPGTDFTANSAVDGTGTDLTAFFAVVAAFTGEDVHFAIANVGGIDGYITKLQVRGQGIYRTDAQIDRDVPGQEYGARLLELDMPFQSNINTADSVATVYQDLLGQPYPRIQAVTFCAVRTRPLFEAARTLEPGDRITVTETTTGLVAAPFTINSVHLVTDGAGIMWCTWGLETADYQHIWEIDVDTLDDATILGF